MSVEAKELGNSLTILMIYFETIQFLLTKIRKGKANPYKTVRTRTKKNALFLALGVQSVLKISF